MKKYIINKNEIKLNQKHYKTGTPFNSGEPFCYLGACIKIDILYDIPEVIITQFIDSFDPDNIKINRYELFKDNPLYAGKKVNFKIFKKEKSCPKNK